MRQLMAVGFFGLPLVSCVVHPSSGPMPQLLIPAPQHSPDSPLVIVLPGIGDDLQDLQNSGITEAIQRGWPRANVLLVGATLGYYLHGDVAQRLHDDVILPARAHGYRSIWLAGVSMGGMGVMLYARRYPGEASGLVLLAPYMGDAHLVKTIAAVGGPRQWNPGPLPATINKENYQTEIWRVVHNWALHPEATQHIWLAAGSRDRLLSAAQLIAPLLPPEHFFEPQGSHNWKVWDAAATEIFAHIAAQSVPSDLTVKIGKKHL